MKKARIIVVAALALSLLVSSLLVGCTSAKTASLKVVTSTSLIAQIVERVGGDNVDVVNIIPPAQCPGHFDIKPGDIRKLANAGLFLLHNWQGEKFSQALIDSANNPDLTVVKIDDESIKVGENINWMTPPVQQEAVDKITDALCQVDAQNSAAYQDSAAELKDAIGAKEAELQAVLVEANLSGVKVMCADMIVGFVQWTGLDVVAAYGRSETLTPQVVKELVDEGTAAEVTLIIDNMQSGEDVGIGIAEEIGCRQVTLSNFPGGFDNTETWEKAIDCDIELILGALAQ